LKAESVGRTKLAVRLGSLRRAEQRLAPALYLTHEYADNFDGYPAY